MATFLKTSFRLLRATHHKFSADGCPRVGAALAYYSLFSLFPLLLLLISILSFLLASGVPLLVDARTYVLESAGATMPQAGDLLARSIDLALAARGTTTVVGLLTLLWSASNVFTQLYQALNVIWGCIPEPTIMAAVRTKLTAVAVVLGISALLFLSLALNATLGVLLDRNHLLRGWRLLWTGLSPLTSAAMATAFFAMLYRYLPNRSGPWRTIWPGALLAGVAWEVLREGFAFYATRTNYVAVYGPVGSTIALLTWIYFSAQVLFFGAEFSVVYARLRSVGRGEAGAPLPGESCELPAQGRAERGEGILAGLSAFVVSVAMLLQGTWQGFQQRLGVGRERDP